MKYVEEGSNSGYPICDEDENDDLDRCEWCGEPATDRVDLDPVHCLIGTYTIDLCADCAAFERARIDKQIVDNKLFKLKIYEQI